METCTSHVQTQTYYVGDGSGSKVSVKSNSTLKESSSSSSSSGRKTSRFKPNSCYKFSLCRNVLVVLHGQNFQLFKLMDLILGLR